MSTCRRVCLYILWVHTCSLWRYMIDTCANSSARSRTLYAVSTKPPCFSVTCNMPVLSAAERISHRLHHVRHIQVITYLQHSSAEIKIDGCNIYKFQAAMLMCMAQWASMCFRSSGTHAPHAASTTLYTVAATTSILFSVTNMRNRL